MPHQQPMTAWAVYVRNVAGRRVSQRAIAARAHLDPSTIWRWLNEGRVPNVEAAIGFARSYGANPVEALVAAGYLSLEETRLRRHTLDAVPSEALADELARRADSSAA